MKRSGWLWLGWVTLLAGSFAVLEGIALANDIPGDTLSEWVWKLMDYTAFRVPFIIIFTGGIIWLAGHWLTRDRW